MNKSEREREILTLTMTKMFIEAPKLTKQMDGCKNN